MYEGGKVRVICEKKRVRKMAEGKICDEGKDKRGQDKEMG